MKRNVDKNRDQKKAIAALPCSEADHSLRLEHGVTDYDNKLLENYTLLQTIYNTTLIGMSVFVPIRDLQDTIVDFKIINANREFERAYCRENIISKLYSEIHPDVLQGELFNKMVETMKTGEPSIVEHNYKINGIEFWYSTTFARGDDILVGSSLDITERKLLEEKRLRALALLTQSEKLAGIGSWDYDILSGSFTWSDGMYRLFNLRIGVDVKPSIYLEYATADCIKIASRVTAHIEQGDTEFQECLTIRVNEVVKVLKLKTTIIRDYKGQPLRVLGVNLDITAVRAGEQNMLNLEADQQQEIFRVTLRVEEEERRRISESLHNGLGQLLYGIKMSIDDLNFNVAKQDEKEYASAKSYSEALLMDAIKETRRISHEMMPSVLEEFGLKAALDDICQQFQNGVKFHCRIDLKGRILDKYIELAVFRTVQELMLNVVKHAQASVSNVEIEVKGYKILIMVEDNGKGFDLRDETGIGLSSIRSKAGLLKGNVDVASTPMKGTVVKVSFTTNLTAD